MCYLCNVKIIAVILSMYFLALNLVPCSDDGISHSADVEFQVDLDHDQDGHNGDLCSPFCQCHCCHVHTINFGIVDFVPISIPISQESFGNLSNTGQEITYSLLQPPRV